MNYRDTCDGNLYALQMHEQKQEKADREWQEFEDAVDEAFKCQDALYELREVYAKFKHLDDIKGYILDSVETEIFK